MHVCKTAVFCLLTLPRNMAALPVEPRDLYPGLPDPLLASDPDLQQKLNAIAVEDHVSSGPSKRKRTRGGNKKYTNELKLLAAKEAIRVGCSKTAKRLTHELGHHVPESTIRNWQKTYLRQVDNGPVEKLAEKKRGRPTKLPDDCDRIVQKNVRSQYKSGAGVSLQKVLAIGENILKKKHPHLAKKVRLNRPWGQSLFRRMNFVFRKVTKASQQPPEDLESSKAKFYRQIRRAIQKYSIPQRLIINIDQVCLQIVPPSNFTMAPRGSKQVGRIGANDKRAITGLIGCTIRGRLLPPQIIYQGKSDRCYPSHEYPSDWHITHNENHWSDGITMDQYIHHVLVPYIEKVRSKSDYDEDQKALLILDTFAAHCTEEFKEALEEANIKPVFVPPGTTGILQPLDADGSVNYAFKIRIKNNYNEFLSECVHTAMDTEGNLPDGWMPDMRLSNLKPLHAQWIQDSWMDLKEHKEIVKNGWQKTGITEAIEDLYE